MNDLLKREKVLRTIQKMFDCCTTYDINDYRDLMTEAIKVLPPERQLDLNEPQGEWIKTDRFNCGARVYQCSICSEDVDEMPTVMGVPKYRFCPYCRAKMKGESDDTRRI